MRGQLASAPRFRVSGLGDLEMLRQGCTPALLVSLARCRIEAQTRILLVIRQHLVITIHECRASEL